MYYFFIKKERIIITLNKINLIESKIIANWEIKQRELIKENQRQLKAFLSWKINSTGSNRKTGKREIMYFLFFY